VANEVPANDPAVVLAVPANDNAWRMRFQQLMNNDKMMKCTHFKIKRFVALCAAKNASWGTMADNAFANSIAFYLELNDITADEKALIQAQTAGASVTARASVTVPAVKPTVPVPAVAGAKRPREMIEEESKSAKRGRSGHHELERSGERKRADANELAEFDQQDRLHAMADAVVTQVVAKTTAAIDTGLVKIKETLSTEIRELKNYDDGITTTANTALTTSNFVLNSSNAALTTSNTALTTSNASLTTSDAATNAALTTANTDNEALRQQVQILTGLLSSEYISEGYTVARARQTLMWLAGPFTNMFPTQLREDFRKMLNESIERIERIQRGSH